MSEDEKIRASVVVCSYNGMKYIGTVLTALFAQDFPKDEYEIVVVDDGSTDGLSEYVTRRIEGVENTRLITLEKNGGLSNARNTGWQAAVGQFILYTDDDAIPDNDWITRIVGGYADDIDGFGGFPRPFFNNIYDHYAEAAGWYQYGKNGEKVDGAGGLNMSFKRKLLEETGGFNPHFTHIADDAEMNSRLTKLGYRLKVDGSITVRHRSARAFTQHKRMLLGRGKGAYIFDSYAGAELKSFPVKRKIAEVTIGFPELVRRAYKISSLKCLRYFLPFLFIEVTSRWLYCTGYENAKKADGK